jgi:hypothetical protein
MKPNWSRPGGHPASSTAGLCNTPTAATASSAPHGHASGDYASEPAGATWGRRNSGHQVRLPGSPSAWCWRHRRPSSHHGGAARRPDLENLEAWKNPSLLLSARGQHYHVFAALRGGHQRFHRHEAELKWWRTVRSGRQRGFSEVWARAAREHALAGRCPLFEEEGSSYLL